ncbi:aminopeptidase [Chloroflexota bacterium]
MQMNKVDIRDNLRLILEKIMQVKPGKKLLVLTDTYARSRSIGYATTELANSIGIKTVMTIMEPCTQSGEEPPAPVAAAMKSVDYIFELSERSNAAHTNARKEATDLGAKYYAYFTDLSEDYLRTLITFEDLKKLKSTTDKLAVLMTKANKATITSPYGTNLTMSLEGRIGLPLSPLTDEAITGLLDSAETATAPIEGTTEGIVVVDAQVRGWGYLLRTPIRFEVKNGKIQLDTISSNDANQAERFKKMVTIDQNASNCAAELGIGASHTAPKTLRGDFLMDYAVAGTVHIAVGRNNDIGGTIRSDVHTDLLLTGTTVKLDDFAVIENGELKI